MKRTRRCLALLLAMLAILSVLPVSGLAASSVKTLKQSTWYTAQNPDSGSFTPYKLKLTKETIVYVSWKSAGADLDANACFCKDTEGSEVVDGIYPYDRASGKEGVVLYPGTYYVRLSDTSKQAKFKFTTKKASALSFKNTSSKKATSLKAKKKAEMVFDTKHLKSRWYKIKLTKKQRITVCCSTNSNYVTFRDKNMKAVDNESYTKKAYRTVNVLNPGTYYVRINNYGVYNTYANRASTIWWQ